PDPEGGRDRRLLGEGHHPAAPRGLALPPHGTPDPGPSPPEPTPRHLAPWPRQGEGAPVRASRRADPGVRPLLHAGTAADQGEGRAAVHADPPPRGRSEAAAPLGRIRRRAA